MTHRMTYTVSLFAVILVSVTVVALEPFQCYYLTNIIDCCDVNRVLTRSVCVFMNEVFMLYYAPLTQAD